MCQFTSVLRSGTLLQVGEGVATLGQHLVALVARSWLWLRRRSLVITAEEGGQGGSPRALLRMQSGLLPLFQAQQAQCTHWLTP